MAPITKDAENPAESSSSTAPGPSTPKAGDDSTRTQPVALELPVTVNGARTLEGSDKREPFSESTKTVLIFNQGAVIRIATPVAAGQLVFLTNEKSKKEVVCQVVKSKPSGGPGAGYVELKFTEPAAGFWGMRFPGAPAAPGAPVAAAPATGRPATATVPGATIPAPPSPAVSTPFPASKAVPPVALAAPKPVATSVSSPQPPKPATVPPPPPVAKTEPPKPAVPAIPSPPAPVSFAPPPAPLPPVMPSAPGEEKQNRGIPEIHDYSKEIAAIFAVPPVGSPSQTAPASSMPPAPQASSPPSTEQLKEQTARLQVQLGSMLFSESHAAPPASTAAVSPASNAKPPATVDAGLVPTDSGQKAPELRAPVAKPAAKPVAKPVAPAAKSKSYDIEQVEEVKVPDWLAPLSRSAESSPAPAPAPPGPASEQSRVPGWLAPLSHIAPPSPAPPASPATARADVAAISASPDEASASNSLPAVASEAKSEDTPFGGTMLDESLEPAGEGSGASRSKKGLALGLAAAALLLAGGGVWYMRQTHGGNTSGPAAKTIQAPEASRTVAVSTVPAAKPESAPLAAGPSSSTLSPAPGQPAKSPVVPTVSPAPPVAAKNGAPLTRNEPPAEQPKKPSLGEVRLSAPLVSRAEKSQQAGEADPALGASVPTPGGESLSSLSSGSPKEPAAPLPVGGDVKQARLVKSVPPVYPQLARTQHIAGNVSIDAVVDTDGNVSTMKVLSGPAILHRAALEAVKQWHYEPAMLDGKPTASHLTVIVQFRLQ